MAKELGENTSFKISIRTLLAIAVGIASAVGFYYMMMGEIEEAKKLPPIEVTRLEYELKEEWNEEMIMQLKDQVEMLEQTQDILREEINITSGLVKDGTEADGKLEELNRQLEEIRNQKPKQTIIVKEVEVPKKRR